jgi:hypothetical protein
MKSIKDRARENELNCKSGTMQLLYSLAEHGLLKEPFRSWAAGFEPVPGKELEHYNDAILDISESLIMFSEEIKENGKIL